MRTMTLNAPSGACKIALGESIANLGEYCRGAEKIIAITDTNVRRLHGERLEGVEVISMESGEEHKTLETVGSIVGRLLDLEADRSAFIAGVGGKNGINFRGYKNIIGTIRQPEFCICDFSLLGTLPQGEIRNGFAEAVKTAAIGDASLFSFLEGNWDSAFALQRTAIEKVVHDSLQVKMRIVSADEGEKGMRMKLNFGHTIGHAIEKAAGIPHGEAISIGMVAAASLSRKKVGLDAKEAQGLEKLLKEMGLPTHLGAKKAEVLEAIRKDKKRYGAKIRMVLLERIGSARMADVGLEELEGVVNDMC